MSCEDEDLVAAGRRYLAAGVGPLLPLIGKRPDHYGSDWQDRGITDPDEWTRTVAADSRYTNVGWLQGHGTVALDFDYPDKATDELRAVGRQGAKNPTRPGRGHRIFATEEAYGNSTAGFPCAGWGEVRGKGGQIVIWGPHPDDPERFYCYDETQTVPPAPEVLLGWLSGASENAKPEDIAALETALEERTEALYPAALSGIRTRLEHLTEVLAGRESDPKVKAARHDNLMDLTPWICREALAGLYPLKEARDLVAGWWQSLELPERRARVTVGRNEYTAAWCWGLAQAQTDPERIAEIRAKAQARVDPFGTMTETPPPNVDPETGEVIEEPEPSRDLRPLVVPAEVWEARKSLDHIRTAALSRLVHPTGVLLVVLARVAALSPHTVRIPPTVGSELGMSLLVMLAGHASAGKSGAIATGCDLMLIDDPLVQDRIPPGSGEGLVELLYDSAMVRDENDKLRKKRVLKYHNVFVEVDEGTVLAELSDRKGSTLASTLRTIYTHATLGQANASKDTRRIAHGDQYVYGLVAGIQPEMARPLFTAEALAAGTTQRFVWALLAGEELSDDPPNWPGPLEWTPTGSPVMASRLELPAQVVSEITDDRLAAARTEHLDPMDAHAMLRRLKLAGLLAMLEGRLEVTLEDWQIAEILNDLSQAAMCRVRDRLGAVARQRDDAQTARQDRREATLEVSATTRALASAARSVGRRAQKVGTLNRSQANQAMSGKHRSLVAIDDVLTRAEADGYIAPADEGTWKPGRVIP